MRAVLDRGKAQDDTLVGSELKLDATLEELRIAFEIEPVKVAVPIRKFKAHII